MNKRKVMIFSIIAVIALLGIVITQIFWVDDAVKLRKEQFNQRVKVALKSVSTQILDAQIDSSEKYLLTPCDTDFYKTRSIEEMIDTVLLDSLVALELINMSISEQYVYGVYNSMDYAFVMGAYQGNEDDILGSRYTNSLSCIYKEEVYILAVFFPNEDRMMIDSMIVLVIHTILFLLILIMSFYMIIRLMFKQKRLSQIKTDFINNMTHEFKTPIAAISISSEMLLKPDVNNFPYKTKRYAKVIYDENSRLQKQVEQILQLSIHDRGEIPLKLKEVDMHSIIKQIAERFNVNASKKGGMITTKLNAPHYHLEADKTHISNIIANLIDNALKYTNGQPEIEIITDENNEKFIMHISDNGIGISPENQKYIFNKLYRVPTGNLHDVKGFGLGLYYVKTMIEAHNGSVSVKSETNIGTTFSIELPLNKTNTQ